MLSPLQLRLLTSFKAALSAVIAIGLAMAFDWDNPYWAGISTMVVTLPYMGAALEKAMMRVVGTFLAGATLYLISGAFPQNQLGYCVLLAVTLTISGYFGAGSWYPYTFILYGLTLNILVVDTFQDPGYLFPFVFFRVSEICLGVGVALTVNAAFWPQNAGRAFLALVAKDLEKCRQLFREVNALNLHDKTTDTDFEALEDQITGQLAKLHPLLLQALRDSSQVHKHRRGYEAFLSQVEDLFITLGMLRRAAQAHYPKGYREELMAELDAFTDALDRLFGEIIDKLKSGEIPEALSADTEGEAVDTKIDDLRKADVNLKYSIEDTTHLYTVLANLFDVKKALDSLLVIVADINGGALQAQLEELEASPKQGLDKRRVQHGIKVAIACISALYAWQWLQWQGGAQAAITAGIVMQVTMVASSQKALLRLGGCLLGGSCGALSLVVLEPYFSSYATFCFPLFFFFFIFAWINFGDPAYSYAGFQSFLTFLLMTSVSNTQNISLLPAVDRFLGILLGVCICLVVLRLFWPIIPERELRRDLGLFFKRGSDFLRAYTSERLAGQPATEALSMLTKKVNPVATSAETWLSQIAMHNEKDARNHIRRFALAAQTLGLRLRALEQTFKRESPPALQEKIAPSILAINDAVVQALDVLAESFRECRPPTRDIDFDTPLRALTHTTYKLFREDKIGRPYQGHQVASVLGQTRRYRALVNEARNALQLAQDLDYRALDRTPFF